MKLANLESATAPPTRQIEDQRAVTASLPNAQVGEQRGQPRSRPQQHQIEEARISRTEQHAHTVDRRTQQQGQQILGEEKGLHRKNHVEQQRRVRYTPAHRRSRRADEQGVGGQP